MRRTLLGAIVVLGLFASGTVHGEGLPGPLGGRHDVVISAERLFGFAYWSSTQGANSASPEVDLTGTVIGRLDASYVVPRLALDVFVVRGLTVGGAATYVRGSVDTTVHTQFTPPPQNQTVDHVVLAPRVGYFVCPFRSVGLWPRVGFTYLWSHSSGTSSETLGLYALTLEAPVAIRVAAHVLVTVGPLLDLGLGGSISTTRLLFSQDPPIPNRSLRETDVGLAAGVAGYF